MTWLSWRPTTSQGVSIDILRTIYSKILSVNRYRVHIRNGFIYFRLINVDKQCFLISIILHTECQQGQYLSYTVPNTYKGKARQINGNSDFNWFRIKVLWLFFSFYQKNVNYVTDITFLSILHLCLNIYLRGSFPWAEFLCTCKYMFFQAFPPVPWL